MAHRRWQILFVVAGTLMAGLFSVRSRSAPMAAPDKADHPSLPPGAAVFTGTDSCSGRACHGSLEPRAADERPVLQDEYTKWLVRDPHARAEDVLREPRSQQIARNLAGPGKEVIPAQRDLRCLACHSTPSPASISTENALGVGCEACHGPAQKWLGPHTTKKWEKLSAEKKQADFGMIPVTETKECAQACAGCHVGAPAGGGYALRDVNHDLIAAGHPRLNFEYAAYRANLPPHWNTRRKQHTADEQARDWAVGQIVAAEQALKLLDQRSTAKNGPWPEFAEYDCFACHHDLTSPSWRQQRGYGSRLPGALPWGDWYFSMPEKVALAIQKAEVEQSIQDIRRVMERPLPKNMPISEALAKLERLRGQVGSFDQRALRRLLANEKAPRESWDAAEQSFLAACVSIPSEQPLPKWLQELDVVRAFAKDFDSPRQFQPKNFFERLREGLKQAAEEKGSVKQLP